MWWVKNKQQNTYNTFTSSDGVNWTDQGVIPSNGPNIGTSWYGGAYGNIIHNKHTGKFYHTRNSSNVYESTDGISWSTFSSPSLGSIWNVALANDGSLFGLVWTNAHGLYAYQSGNFQDPEISARGNVGVPPRCLGVAQNSPEMNVSDLIINPCESQLTTPKNKKVRANQSQTGPWQSE